MAEFRRRPTIVEAVQITEEMVAAHLFDKQPLPRGVRMASAEYHGGERRVIKTQMRVMTAHGDSLEVFVGDWIMPESDGEHFYPCKPDIFAATYEPAEAAPPASVADHEQFNCPRCLKSARTKEELMGHTCKAASGAVRPSTETNDE
jgi:hypothetical protein